MRNEIYRLLVLATACHLPCDEAYELLDQDYIDDFKRVYESISGEKPTALDALIDFTMRELPIRTGKSENIVYQLRSQRDAIVETFVNESVTDMFTRLASRGVIQSAVQQYLYRENTMRTIISSINQSRVSVVFSQFLEMFRENCAHAFQYRGSFQAFVMNCFINFFYKGRKQDIWAQIREIDAARREVETSLVQEKLLTVGTSDDLLIHDLLVNTSIVNDLMFKHSGQSDDAYGVMYDLYYLILCLLCERRAQTINEALGKEIVEFVDVYDRKRNHLGILSNKGIAAKVANAKDIVSRVFRYVRTGQLNVASIASLRDECFRSGKYDREGRNCVWKDVVVGGETSRYLDDANAMSNYRAFDEILKGVISVYTLMTELEKRGYYLVDFYDPVLFKNKDIIRYMDYLSSIQFVPLIKQLQAEPLDKEHYTTGLLEFDKMVDEYAGSVVNNHTNIRENRYYAITHGFMRKPRVKQSTVPTSTFEKLRQIACILDSVPHSYRDRSCHSGNPNASAIMISAKEVVSGSYWMPYYNSFLIERPERIEYYVKGEGQLSAMESMDALRWSLASAHYECTVINASRLYGVYSPLHEAFCFLAPEENQAEEPVFASLSNVIQMCRAQTGQLMAIRLYFGEFPAQGVFHKYSSRLLGSISFPYEVGILNLRSPEIKARIDAQAVEGEFRPYINKYFELLGLCAEVQHSFIEVSKVMLMWAISTLELYKNDITRVNELRFASELLTGLTQCEFRTGSLDYVLTLIHNTRGLQTVDFVPKVLQLRDVDVSVVGLCFGEHAVDLEGHDEWLSIVNSSQSPGEKFISLYNLTYTILEFLRYVRDGASAILNLAPTENATLVCELVQNLGIDDKLRGYVDRPVTDGLSTDSIASSTLKNDIRLYRSKLMHEFKTLLGELRSYFKECEDNLASLLNYKISAPREISSQFSEYGQAFAATPDYQGIAELTKLRQRATLDSAGFFLLNGKYFKGRNNNIEYYVHRTGRLLSESSGKFTTPTFRLDEERDRNLYTDILRKGFEDAGL